MSFVKIQRALISVSNKQGIVEFARLLSSSGVELVSTSGTKKIMEENGLKVVDVSAFTGEPECFGGRVKTLSHRIAAGILYDREKDLEEARRVGTKPVDLVICNLYPFEKYAREQAPFDVLIEHMDIGGITLIRAAAKNHKYVAVLTDPRDYPVLMEEFKRNQGAFSGETRKELMRKAFQLTADYDSRISEVMDQHSGKNSLRLTFDDGYALRYGENPHQKALFYKQRNAVSSIHELKSLTGKELSYNNLLDIQNAVRCVRGLSKPACAIIKHGNPCGLAVAATQIEAFQLAWAGDPVSAFGSVIAFNQKLELEFVSELQGRFIEVIVAPEIPEEILPLLGNKNLRLVEWRGLQDSSDQNFRFLDGALLVQDADQTLCEEIKLCTSHRPPFEDPELIHFGLRAVRELQSNAIAIVRRDHSGSYQLLGSGMGQPNRVTSVELACRKASENIKREAESSFNPGEALMVSDAFFPFADNIEIAHQYGIRWILQPGGSKKDPEVIQKAEELGICMMLCGTRHFRH